MFSNAACKLFLKFLAGTAGSALLANWRAQEPPHMGAASHGSGTNRPAPPNGKPQNKGFAPPPEPAEP